MPRIAPASAQDISSKPRAFMLRQLLAPADDGTVQSEAFQALLSQYGQAKAAGEDLSFDEFAALFAKPSSTAQQGEGECIGYAAFDESGKLSPWKFDRRKVGPADVRIQIAYVGVCHSDIHTAKNEWKGTKYPVVPGHEIAGIVTEVGPKVTKFKIGQKVGVGCLVNSCKDCEQCSAGLEQHCAGSIGTYNVKDHDGTITRGGYSTHVVVNQEFVLNIPDKLNMADAAPLLCAGITVYSPIKRFGFDKPGMHIGVVGLGGLGHMAVKVLKGMGVDVTVISSSNNKKEEATKVLGADHFLVSKDDEQMKGAAGTLDGIIDTVSATHPLDPLMGLLKFGSKLCAVGIPEHPAPVPTSNLVMRRQELVGSLIGGIAQTQEMLNFCAEKGIACMTEHIPVEQVNTAYERVLKSDVRYRFVIDIHKSLIA